MTRATDQRHGTGRVVQTPQRGGPGALRLDPALRPAPEPAHPRSATPTPSGFSLTPPCPRLPSPTASCPRLETGPAPSLQPVPRPSPSPGPTPVSGPGLVPRAPVPVPALLQAPDPCPPCPLRAPPRGIPGPSGSRLLAWVEKPTTEQREEEAPGTPRGGKLGSVPARALQRVAWPAFR